jgi:tRNA threonylcarbamoyladenosine biosynthesis protein TsaE
MNSKESFAPEETMAIAQNLAKDYAHHLILLNGSMGAGKTLFSKGFAQGLGIERPVSSPTYTIMNEYRQKNRCLYHLDLYRINNLEEVIDTGLYEILESGMPCLVEWPERVADLQKLPHLQINFSFNSEISPDYRKISWQWNPK